MRYKGAIGNALLVVCSLIVLVGALLIAEVAVRFLTDVNVLGNSRNLFIAGAYGPSHGNTPNVSAVSFGTTVYIDENGFRVPSANASFGEREGGAILILGDSVAFGPGIQEEKTLAGRLRADSPSLGVYNAAVIGYWAADYKNVVQRLQLEKLKVQRVFLIFTLNDVSRSSAKAIDSALESSEQQQDESAESFVKYLKTYGPIRKTNALLRSNSKLYSLIKGILTDPQYRYWRADRSLYLKDNNAEFLVSVKHIADVNTLLAQKGIPFTVIIAPYEYQLRDPQVENLLPQKKLTDYFSDQNIDFIDSTPKFLQRDVESWRFFLPYDPLHFSELGHAVMYEILKAAANS